MRKRYRIFRRSGVYYVHDSLTGKQESLRTRNKVEAEKLYHARNESARAPLLNRDLGRVYLSASDPDLPTRCWSTVMREIESHGKAVTQERYRRANIDPVLDRIRNKPIVETTAADLLACLRAGTASTNHYLRRLHNLAVGLGWLNWPLLAPKMWPKVQWRKKRGITDDEHRLITSTECDDERRLYYEFLRETGAAQSDAAKLTDANIDWPNRLLCYQRNKLKPEAEPARITIGKRLESLLKQLPSRGPLPEAQFNVRKRPVCRVPSPMQDSET